MIEKTPALVARPTGTADVVTAVEFARERDLALSVRGGGHNIAGTALVTEELTIDMSGLRGVHVDPEARTVTEPKLVVFSPTSTVRRSFTASPA